MPSATPRILVLAAAILGGCTESDTQTPVSNAERMGFFVTSVGIGNGGDLGGLAGADAHCNTLAAAVGVGDRSWRAYLSTQGPGAESARERIGPGPWLNANLELVASDVDSLHSDEGNFIDGTIALDEHGQRVNGLGDDPNEHDILTGTRPDGFAVQLEDDRTCSNWTNGTATGTARIGHHDRLGQGDLPMSWNSAHGTVGCSQADLEFTGGSGRFYCFATD